MLLSSSHKLNLIRALWLTVVVAGFAAVILHEQAASVTVASPLFWPQHSTIGRKVGLPTLVMFAHPHCPCTRASINELSKLMSRCYGKVNAKVFFLRPSGAERGWEKTDNWYSASNIPGVEVVADDNGRERDVFGARTSGEVVLYDANSNMIFHGGITSGRGHEGDNAGLSAVQNYLLRKTCCATSTRTFGCSLADPQQ